MNPALLGRPAVGALALALIVLLMGVDLLTAVPIDPYQAPPPTALGSGEAPTAAHCTAL